MPNHPKELSWIIKKLGTEIGFEQVGITDTDVTKTTPYFINCLKKDYHGKMTYLKNNLNLRLDPKNIMPQTKSIICCSLNYLSLPQNTPTYIAKYALGQDYHRIMRKKLKTLVEKITAQIGKFTHRIFCDTAPILEKTLAAKAGLGWIGKNTLLINSKFGSYSVLGIILTDLNLAYDQPLKSRCGTCLRCLQACPTQALIAPRTLDARRCVAYLTIEHKNKIPTIYNHALSNKIFGCDICQQVCPWNRFSKITQESAFIPHDHWLNTKLEELLAWDEKTFYARTKATALERLSYKCWQRNLKKALANPKKV